VKLLFMVGWMGVDGGVSFCSNNLQRLTSRADRGLDDHMSRVITLPSLFETIFE